MWRSIFLAFGFFAFTSAVHADFKLVYPNVDGIGDRAYGYQVLDLAMKKSGVPYQLTLNPLMVNQARARIMIEEGDVSAFDFGTSPEFEQRFLPVYFPIDRGLNGYRLFLIHRDSADAFAAINSIAQLRRKVAVQGVNWSDIAILQKAGIRVYSAPFESLFKMLDAKRVDFFPLGVNEVHSFFDGHSSQAPNLMVENHILLIYPFGRLFFLRKGNEALRDAIMTGLEIAFADGSFQKLLNTNASFKVSLQNARLEERVQIRIENPFLTPAFMKIPRKYFYEITK